MMTKYDFIRVNKSTLELIVKNGLNADMLRALPIYEEYIKMIACGEKATYAQAYLSEKYEVCEKTIRNYVRLYNEDFRLD